MAVKTAPRLTVKASKHTYRRRSRCVVQSPCTMRLGTRMRTLLTIYCLLRLPQATPGPKLLPPPHTDRYTRS